MKGVLFILFALFSSFLASGQSTLVIKVEGLKKNKGELFIGLYNNEQTFKDTNNVFVKQIIPVDSIVMETVMENLPDGEYALTLFHDENSNGKLDKNFLGAPKERYGFSNHPRIVFKAPKLDKCQFSVTGETEVVIKMKK